MFYLERAPIRGRNLEIDQVRGEEVTGLRGVNMENGGKDFLEG